MAIALNIPSQIEKYLSVALFPATGNEFTLYIANDTNRLYQWNGAAYIEVSQQDAVNWGSIGGDIINQNDLQLALAGKVNVEAGKGLSTNDYTTAEKNKLAGIEAGAQVNDVDSVNGYTGAVVLSKSDVGLSNVDNTSDLNKPISTATQTALNAKENTITAGTTSQYFRGDKTFQALDKAAVGLGNVDNTSDANKPISTATQAALNAKQNTLVSGTNIKTINGSSILGSGDLLTIPQLTTAQRDALTPVAGYPIYNTTEGYLESYDNFWGWMPVANQNEWMRKWGMEYWNDFGVQSNVLADGNLYTLVQNGGLIGVSFGTPPSVGNYIGFMGLRTGSATNGVAQLRGDGSWGRTKIQGFGKYVLETRIFTRALSTATDRYTISAGDSNASNTTISSGTVFVYDEGGVGTGTIASPNWQIVTAAGGVRSVFVTSVVVAINTWYKFRIEINDNSTEAKYYIDDVLVRTETTNVPIQGSNFIQTNIAIGKATGTTEVAILVDYVGIKKKFTIPR